MVTDQPGRVLAVLVFGPLLIFKGRALGDLFIFWFGVLLVVWDLYWLLYRAPRF